MPGLLDQKRQAPQAAAATGGGEESVNASPEEQAQYDKFVTNGMKVLYSDKAMPKFLDAIGKGETPISGLANALTLLVTRLEDSAGEKGTKISGDIMLHGGTELLEQMADLAEQAGVHEFQEDEIESALYLAMDQYRATRQQQGRLPEEELRADFEGLMQADQAGKLDEIIPGISEYAKNAPTPDAAPPTQRGV